MTDAQLGLLVAALGSAAAVVAAALRWSVGRITKALDVNSYATLRGARALARIEGRLRLPASDSDQVPIGELAAAADDDFEAEEEPSEVRRVRERVSRERVPTPVRGVRPPRRGTHHDD